MAEFAFNREDVLQRAAVLGVHIDESEVDAVARQMHAALMALAAFDLREHRWSEPAPTYDPRQKPS